MLLPLFLYLFAQCAVVQAVWQYADPQRYPGVPSYGPKPGPDYMVDNQNNYYGKAPDKGKQSKQNGPVWRYSGSLENYMKNLKNKTVIRGGYDNNNGTQKSKFSPAPQARAADTGYWLAKLGTLGQQPLAGEDYQFFRDVTDFGADSSGGSDAAESINAAVSAWNLETAKDKDSNKRCGKECGNTFTMGAIIYFPPGTYKICSPIIQLYYTQFIGDVNNPPTIKGCSEFVGTALVDTDPYIPGASGAQWYINQNQFFRQIRNFIFDLKDMPPSINDDHQPLVPTGIHWQVAQATSLQNLVFNMPEIGGDEEDATTAVGIFTENGSGGFVSDLTFNGGNIGWRVGSQQFTARNLQFNNCSTAVQMIWDWGFTWHQIEVNGGAVAFNISGVGGDDGQGVGSISLVDSVINDVPVGILTNDAENPPNIVLDNTKFNNVGYIVQVDGGDTLLSENVDQWATGKRYNGSESSSETGKIENAPQRAFWLLDEQGRLFVRSRPQYGDKGPDAFLVATDDGNCANDGSGDQTSCINSFLQAALKAGKIAYFPAGIYTVASTVFIPINSQVQGSSWSQIQGSGHYFSDMHNPKVVIQVGNKGDVGTMEIVEMLFSVRGNTAGAIVVEWNVAPIHQGAVAMWDSHVRVGGGKGTDLDVETCFYEFGLNENCIAASLMFRVTSQASGYFENVWAWLADHDNDLSVFGKPSAKINRINLYGARGMLIESQGPSWFYGGGSEHSVLYNYLISNAAAVYLGHIQTEAPYFQPNPGAPAPFEAVVGNFPNDPDFSSCEVIADVWDEQCRYSWGLRIIDSNEIILHSAGLYSFFNDNLQECVDTRNCQTRILEVQGSYDVVIYNLFTVAAVNMANGIDGSYIPREDNQHGFTTEVSVWVPLPGSDHVNIVYVGSEIFKDPIVSCDAPCLLVIPSTKLPAPTTISPSEYTTRLEFGTLKTTSTNGVPITVFVTSTIETVITIPPITIEGMPFSNVKIPSPAATPVTIYPSVNIPPVTLQVPDGAGGSTSRVVELPPWPLVNLGPSGTGIFTDPGTATSTSGLVRSTTYYTGIKSTVAASAPTVTTLTFPSVTAPITISCPATTQIAFQTPAITVRTICNDREALTLSFACPTTKVFTFLGPSTVVVEADCSLVTAWSTGRKETTTALPTFTTWPRYGTIEPVTTVIEKPESNEDDSVSIPCRAWFFFICISWGDHKVGGWRWILPPGVYGPGPPPINLIRWPPGFTLKGTLPPWPRVTIGYDHKVTTEEKPECQTRTAEACTTATVFSVTTKADGNSITTGSSTSTRCETISGCSVTGSNQATSIDEVEGTHTIAPVGTWIPERWPTDDPGEAYTNSVLSELSASFAEESARSQGTVISFTPGPTASPICAGGTACGGHVCTGYWCSATPTGFPPGFQDPKDPNVNSPAPPIEMPDPIPVENFVPDCMWIYISQYSGVQSRRTLMRPDIYHIYDTPICGGYGWCDSPVTGPDGNPLCGQHEAQCAKRPLYHAKINNGRTFGWADLEFSGERINGGKPAYMGIPEDKSQFRKTSCPAGLSKEAECYLRVYAAYIADGSCEHPHLDTLIKTGLAKKMTRKEVAENAYIPS